MGRRLNHSKKLDWANAVGPFVGVLVGAVFTVATQYWITYQGIEKPKIDLEVKKVTIEAHRQVLLLSPNMAVTCKASSTDSWTWKILCSIKNMGSYPVDAFFESVQISLDSDTGEVLYQSGNGFEVQIPNKKSSFRAFPTSTGDLWFYIVFDKTKYQNGIDRNDLIGRVKFKFETLPTAREFLLTQFPSLKDFVDDAASNGTNVFVPLITKRSNF